jgi:serine/threonine protein kinase
MTEDWTKWESQIVNGVFPLLRFLGKSNHSVVFLTEAQGSANAAIKLIPADPTQAEAQLSNWRAVAPLAHPHLVRLLDLGRCQLGGYPFLFVVMEYADQTLAQILLHRALTADEVREMLPPTLNALAFLHRKNLVHRQLKPSNFLVVNDQLKLSSDSIGPVGESAPGFAKACCYDPPETNDGGNSAAGDIWGLGIVIAEALTQRPPAWPDDGSDAASLPATLAPEFAGMVRRCLSRNPASRPTVADLEAQIKPAPQEAATQQAMPQPSAVAAPRPVVPDTADQVAATQVPAKRHSLFPAVALALVVLVGVWAIVRHFHSHADSQQAASSASPNASQLAAAPAGASQNPKTSASDQTAPAMSEVPPAVLHQEIPNVPRSARESIHGHIKVTVRVAVDRSGAVVGQALEDPGSSKYFARVATEAARKWRFVPADDQNSREWLLRFEFGRDGTTARAASPRS